MGDDHDGLSVNPERFSIFNVKNLILGWATRIAHRPVFASHRVLLAGVILVYSAIPAIKLR